MPQKSFKAKQQLGEAFRVEQCPMLVVIDPDGNVVTTEGVEIVTKDTDGECFPWTPKPLYDLSTLEPEILGARVIDATDWGGDHDFGKASCIEFHGIPRRANRSGSNDKASLALLCLLGRIRRICRFTGLDRSGLP